MKKLFSLISWIPLFLSAASLGAQTLQVDKTSLSFSGLQAGPVSPSQSVNVTSSGASISFFAVSNAQWLKLSIQSSAPSTLVGGTTPATISVTADPTAAGVVLGTNTGTITISGGTGSNVTIAVNFAVSTIGVSPSSLQFTTLVGTVPAGTSLTLTGSTTTSYTASASSTGNWLGVGQIAGSSPGTLPVVLNSVIAGFTAGTYSGSVTITPTSGLSAGTPIVVPVTLTVTPTQSVAATPSPVLLNYQIGGASGSTNTPQQTLTISTTGSQALNFNMSAATDNQKPWLTINPASGQIPANGSTTATVGYDITQNLAPGTYTGTVSIFSAGSPSPLNVPVKLVVSTSPLLVVNTSTLTFNYELSGSVPSAQQVTPLSTAVTAIPYTVTVSSNTPWLAVSPATASTGQPFSVSINQTAAAALAPGTYSGSVTVTGTGTGNGPQTIPVSLTVANDPAIQASATLLAFPYQVNQTAAVVLTQTVGITSSTGAPLTYTTTSSTTKCGSSWLLLGGNISGTTAGSLTVTVNPTGISPEAACTGSITITATNPATGNAALGSPLTIPVTMYVSSNPLLVVTPATLPAFTAQYNGQIQQQSITLSSTTPASPLNWTVTSFSSNGNWLSPNTLNGSTLTGSNQLTLLANPYGLTPGNYTGTVNLAATNSGGPSVANSPITIPVSFSVTAGTISVSPTLLAFSFTMGGSAPGAQTLAVSSSGQALTYTAVAASDTGTWLSVSPASGTTPGNLSVIVDPSKLSPGMYNGSITITSPFATGSPLKVPVVLTVSAGTISASPAAGLTFTEAAGGTAPASQNITVAGTPAPLNFTVTTDTKGTGTWLSASPTSGTTPGTVAVSVDATGLKTGSYTGTVTITSTGAAGSPVSIPITFNVVPPQTMTASPAQLNFSYTIGLAAPASQNVTVSSSGTALPFTVAVKTKDGANWLTVAPTSGTTGTAGASILAVSVSPASLAAGNYMGTITITSPNAVTPASVTVNLSVAAVPPPVLAAVTNAASYAAAAISPGENITIFGTGLGPATLQGLQLNADGTVATTVSDTQVTFDGVAAPIVYVSATQTSVMVPYEITGRATTTIRVFYKGVQSAALVYNVAQAVPGIYTQNAQGTGPGAIVNQNYTVNGPANGAPKGSAVAVYMTGEGQTSPGGVTGSVTPTNGTGLKNPVAQPVTATVGGVTAKVDYAGSAPGIVAGVMQVNVEIPAAAPSGAQPIVISIGGINTQTGVTVQVQ